MKNILVIFLGFLSVVYLLNPSAGIFELLPDTIPFVGNVDEGLAAFVLYSSIEYFRGSPIGLFRNWRKMSHSNFDDNKKQ